MAKTINVGPADEALRTIVSEASDAPCFLVVNGRREAVVLGTDAYESLLETLQIESDEELVGSVRRGMQDLAAGRTKPAGAVLSRIRSERGARR
jgi:PHD/YefM family antitoxin component YafN of YafNO toxin-antitoxin module